MEKNKFDASSMRSCDVSDNQQLSFRFLSFHSLHLVANSFALLCSTFIFLLFAILFGFVLFCAEVDN